MGDFGPGAKVAGGGGKNGDFQIFKNRGKSGGGVGGGQKKSPKKWRGAKGFDPRVSSAASRSGMYKVSVYY